MGFWTSRIGLYTAIQFACLLAIVVVSCSGLARQIRLALEDRPDVSSIHQGMHASVDDAIGVLVTTAAQVALTVPSVRDCYLSGENSRSFDPTPLVNAVLVAKSNTDGGRGDVLQGCGVITVSGADVEGNTTDDDLDNKISFEVTAGSIVSPACPEYLYGYTDQSATYASYCIASDGQIDYGGGVRYSGPDYGLTPEERALYLGSEPRYRAILTPVFDLVGLSSISYELATRCISSARAAYALVFAQTNLELLSARFDAAFTDAIGPSGVAFTVGGADGLMLVASRPGLVVNVSQTAWGTTLQSRYSPYNTSNSIVNAAARLISSKYGSVPNWAPILASELAKLPPNASIEWINGELLVSASLYDYEESGAAPLYWINIVSIDLGEFKLKARSRVSNYSARIAAVLLFAAALAALIVANSFNSWMTASRQSGRVSPLQAEGL